MGIAAGQRAKRKRSALRAGAAEHAATLEGGDDAAVHMLSDEVGKGALEKAIGSQVKKVAKKAAKKAMKGVAKKAKKATDKVKSAPGALKTKAVKIAAKFDTKEKVKRMVAKKMRKQNKILKKPFAPVTAKQKLLIKLSGCRDMARFKDICGSKKALCKDKRFGPAVQRQCPATCGLCQRSPPKTNVKVSCNPKPILKTLKPSMMKASSSLGKGREAFRAKLHTQKTPWVAGKQRKGQWLQVSLPEEMLITSIATQGRYNGNQWVKYYKLMHKKKHWRWYSGGKWMRGNWDRTHTRKHALRPFKAKILRLYPQKWHHKISMRLEVWGCVPKKNVVPTDKIAKTLAKNVSKVVDARVNAAAANAMQAVQQVANKRNKIPNAKLKAMVTNAVERATSVATKEIRKAAVGAVGSKSKKLVSMELAKRSTTKQIKSATHKAVDAATQQVAKLVSKTGLKKKKKKEVDVL